MPNIPRPPNPNDDYDEDYEFGRRLPPLDPHDSNPNFDIPLAPLDHDDSWLLEAELEAHNQWNDPHHDLPVPNGDIPLNELRAAIENDIGTHPPAQTNSQGGLGTMPPAQRAERIDQDSEFDLEIGGGDIWDVHPLDDDSGVGIGNRSIAAVNDDDEETPPPAPQGARVNIPPSIPVEEPDSANAQANIPDAIAVEEPKSRTFREKSRDLLRKAVAAGILLGTSFGIGRYTADDRVKSGAANAHMRVITGEGPGLRELTPEEEKAAEDQLLTDPEARKRFKNFVETVEGISKKTMRRAKEAHNDLNWRERENQDSKDKSR